MRISAVAILTTAVITCGPPPESEMGNLSTGGVRAKGGAVATGGSSISTNGGQLSTGGTTPVATGGRVATGGNSITTGGNGGGSGGSGGTVIPGSGGSTSSPDAAIFTANDHPGCMNEVIANTYACGSAKACSQCMDNSTSLEDKCKTMVNCLQKQWPCSGNCWQECLNKSGGSGVLDGCVKALSTAACSGSGCGGGTPTGPDASVSKVDAPISPVDAPEGTADGSAGFPD